MFKFILRPYVAFKNTVLDIHHVAHKKKKDGEVWSRELEDGWEQNAIAAARASRWAWHAVASTPLLFGYAIYANSDLFFWWTAFWFGVNGAVLALRYAVIARQRRTNDLNQSRWYRAFADGWWYPS